MKINRRKFLRHSSLGAAGVIGATTLAAHPFNIIRNMRISPNDKIRLATIGFGIQGHFDTMAALRNEDVELVAGADLYTGRLAHVKEVYGKEVFTTRDYREILQRDDIDAVIVATSDHWHDTITIDALKAGKHVYCEKPMVQSIDEGKAVIDAWKDSGLTMQVGSQPISGAVYREAKRLVAAGEIGEINLIEANSDRFSAIGAWNYTIPTDASPETVDWDTFLKDTAKLPFDEKRFFRWRNYQAYGTGVAGDLFVHLINGVHYTIDSLGPNRIYASGNLSYWKDGRDVADVMVAIMDYPQAETHPAFQMVLRVNFANAGKINNNTRIIGTEGQIDFGGGKLTLSKKTLPKAPGIGGYDSMFTFTEAEQKRSQSAYDAKYSEADRQAPPVEEIVFEAPEEDDAHKQHFADFFDHMRRGSQGTIEDPVFGFRAAAPVLACNDSAYSGKVINWDAEKMEVVK